MSAFSEALARAVRYEGGFVDHPADKGGATNKGVTQVTYDAYRIRHKKPTQSVRAIDDDEAHNIYFELYWSPAKCIAIEASHRPLLAQAHFDAAINHGVGNAAKMLQRSLGVLDDGAIGPVTIAAVAQCDDVLTTSRYLDERALFFARIVEGNASQGVFIEGWTARVIRLRNELLQPAARAA